MALQAGVDLIEHLALCEKCRLDADEAALRRDFENLSAQFESPDPAPPPPEVPNHEVEPTPIGTGSSGHVYRGRHVELGQARAIKVVWAPANSLAAVRNEAHVMAGLPPDPHRVQVYDVQVIPPDRVVLVLSYSEGGTLASKPLPLPWEEAVRYMLDVCKGLEALHARNLVHRDIKPGNLFLNANDEAVLGDFGLALPAGEGGGPAGTSGYMAPELLDGPATLKSDVFSLAATLYALLAGRPPFDGRNPYRALLQAKAGLPRPMPALDGVPAGVEDVVRVGLAPDPARRPGLDEFLGRLRTVHLHELAGRFQSLAAQVPSPKQLTVHISVAADANQPFRPLLTCTNPEGPATGAAPIAVVRISNGHLIKVETTAEAAGYLTVLSFDTSAGELRVVVPGPLAQENEVRPSPPQTVYLLKTPSPAGDHLAFVWTRARRNIPARVWRDWIVSGGLDTRGVELIHQVAGRPPEGALAAVIVRLEDGPGGG